MSDVGISVSITIIVLLMCSAFFSGAEVALFSLQASAREELSTTKPAGWKYVLRLLRTPHHLLITILVGNTFVNTAIAVIAALVTAHIAAQFGWNQTLSFTIEVIAVTFIVIVVSEVTPKIIAARTPTSAARKIALPLYLVSLLLYPVVVLLVGFIRTVERNVPLSRQADPLTGEDVKILADVVSEDGEINEEERKIIHRMVDAKGMIVREIMTSRPGMVALDAAKTSLDDIVTFFAAQQHSRIPLYRGSVDAIIGILYAKDVIPFLSSPREFPAGKKNADILRLCREAYFIPENKSVEALLEDFQEKKTHVAIVVDEYGRTSGIVTFHDVIRAVVGSGGEEQRADSEREKTGKDKIQFSSAESRKQSVTNPTSNKIEGDLR